jgi:dihydroflavonol-4-reductase
MGQVLLRLFRDGMPALVEGGFDWVDARDVAGGMIAAAERGRPGERYLLGGRWASLRELARLAGAAAGVRPPRLVSPMWLARLGAPFSEAACRVMGWRPLYSSASLDNLAGHGVVSHAKAAGELGYVPRPLRETVEDTYRWCREAGLV